MTVPSLALIDLQSAFKARGFDIRYVGGCVRDMLRGVECKDIDLATDATPDEQSEIYVEQGVSHYPTGLQHGTWTIVLDNTTFEITSLRTETNHDGRHATVSWTRDWTEDLSRRDLKINAMAMTFDGDIIDPFGGQDDLTAKRVRFVGNAADRMKEDYLRILRFFRFHGRIAGEKPFDEEAFQAAKLCAPGMAGISRERIWSEMSRIITGPAAGKMVQGIIDSGLLPYMDLPEPPNPDWAWKSQFTCDPVSTFVVYLNGDTARLAKLSADWKWSAEDRDRGVYLSDFFRDPIDYEQACYRIAVDGHNQTWVAERFSIQGDPGLAERLRQWSIPVFPVTGKDLLAIGIPSSPKMGDILRTLKVFWGQSGFRFSKAELMAYFNDMDHEQ